MSDSPQHLGPDLLLAHADFIRGLARGLLGDGPDADDLAHDVIVQALRHPPQEQGNLRGWFARVAGNLRSNRLRDEGRRRSHERGAAVQPARGHDYEPPVDEILAREEVRRKVVARVVALPEPYRSVVILRYFEGLDSPAIGARLGRPAATVRGQLRDGLARLRNELDAEHGGDRRAWALPLAAAVPPCLDAGPSPLEPAPVHGLPSGGLLPVAWATGAVVSLLALSIWWVLGSSESTPERAAVEVAAAPHSTPTSGSPEGPIAGTRSPVASARWIAPPPDLWICPSDRPTTQLSGTVVDAIDRSPVEGATVRVLSRASETREPIEVADDLSIDLELTTDSFGHFTADVPAGRYRIFAASIDGTRRGRTTCVAGDRTACEAITIDVAAPHPLEGKVFVEVVDPEQQPVAAAHVRLFASDTVFGPIGFDGTEPIEGHTDADGRCLLADSERMLELFEGIVLVTTSDGRSGTALIARPEHGNGLPCERIVVGEPGVLTGAIEAPPAVLKGLEISARRVLVYGDVYPDCAALSCSATIDGDRYRIEGLPAGAYALRFDSPAGATLETPDAENDPFGMWSRPIDRVSPGETVIHDVRLIAGETLHGRITDPQGEPLAGASIQAHRVRNSRTAETDLTWLHREGWIAPVSPDRILAVETGVDGRFTLRGLAPGGYRIVVARSGCATEQRDVEVTTGDVEPLEITLWPGGRLEAIGPAADLAIRAIDPVADPDRWIALRGSPDRPDVPLLREGRYRVAIWQHSDDRYRFDPIGEVGIQAGRTTWIDLRDAGSTSLEGLVHSPGSGPVAGALIRLGIDGPTTTTGADGRFSLRTHSFARAPLWVLAEELCVARIESPLAQPGPLEVLLEERPFEIRIERPDGSPAAATLQWRQSSQLWDSPSGTLRIDGSRRFRFEPPGLVHTELRFDSGGALRHDLRPESLADTGRRLEFTEPVTSTLILEVTDPHGRPAIGRAMSARFWTAEVLPPTDPQAFAEGSDGGRRAYVDLGGRLTLRGIPGSHVLVYRGGRMQEPWAYGGVDRERPPFEQIYALSPGGTVRASAVLPDEE